MKYDRSIYPLLGAIVIVVIIGLVYTKYSPGFKGSTPKISVSVPALSHSAPQGTVVDELASLGLVVGSAPVIEKSEVYTTADPSGTPILLATLVYSTPDTLNEVFGLYRKYASAHDYVVEVNNVTQDSAALILKKKNGAVTDILTIGLSNVSHETRVTIVLNRR